MRIVCVSDTHNCNGQIAVPDGDLIIHSGDATINGTLAEVAGFVDWFAALPHKHKIFVAGNHDWLFERDNRRARLLVESAGIIYLQDESVELLGMKIYGSPWQPRFFDWAFNLNRGREMAEKWAMIPDDVDILITHGPPNGVLDEVQRAWGIENTGCEELRKRVESIIEARKLRLHVFGHIHSGYGVLDSEKITFVNASACDEEYKPTQMPIVVDI